MAPHSTRLVSVRAVQNCQHTEMACILGLNKAARAMDVDSLELFNDAHGQGIALNLIIGVPASADTGCVFSACRSGREAVLLQVPTELGVADDFELGQADLQRLVTFLHWRQMPPAHRHGLSVASRTRAQC